ncbi:unnamed protein product [Closterium sp. NIES-54]
MGYPTIAYTTVVGAGGVGGAGVGDLGAGDRGAGGTGAGGAGAGGAGAGDPGAGGTGAGGTSAGGARAGGTGDRDFGALGTGDGGAKAGGAGAGDPRAGGAGAGETGDGGAGAGGTGAVDPGVGGAGARGAGAGGTGAGGTVQRRSFFVPPPPSSLPPPDSVLRQSDSPLPAPSTYAEHIDSLKERREPKSHSASPVRTGRHVPRPRPPPVPGTHIMALRPSSVPLQVPLPPPPASSLFAVPDPKSNLARTASPTVPCLLATDITDPSFESTAASALVAELVNFVAACRLDYTTSLVAESDLTVLCPSGWSLQRPVYGLRQAPREWHDTLRTTLAALGFAPSTADPSLFLRSFLPPFYILVYVDDLVFATDDTEALALVKSEVQKRHTCTDMGELRSYLGLQITRDRALRTITLNQSHMVHQVFQRFGLRYSSPQSTPLPTGHSLSAPPSDKSVEPSGPY